MKKGQGWFYGYKQFSKEFNELALEIMATNSKYGLNFGYELQRLKAQGATEDDILQSFFQAVQNCQCFIFQGPKMRQLVKCWYAKHYPRKKAYIWQGKDCKITKYTLSCYDLIGQHGRWEKFFQCKGQIKQELYHLILEKILDKKLA